MLPNGFRFWTSGESYIDSLVSEAEAANKWIFHSARSAPLTPAWFKGQLYLPFHL